MIWLGRVVMIMTTLITIVIMIIIIITIIAAIIITTGNKIGVFLARIIESNKISIVFVL